MSKPKLIEQNWTNSLGQTISPGDKVLAIASGYLHCLRIREGTFVGTVNGNPSVVTQQNILGYWDGDKNVGYSKGNTLKIRPSHKTVARRSTLPAKRVYKLA